MDYGPSSDLRIVDPRVNQDLANFFRLNFWEFHIPSTVVQDGPSMPTLVAHADFSGKKTEFLSVLAMGCYIISPLGIFMIE